LITENFNYSTGTLINASANWKTLVSGTTGVEVIDGNLAYPNYALSNIGKMVLLNGGTSSGSCVYRNFTSQSKNNVSVYYSFLLNLINASNLDVKTSIGDYFVNFITSQKYFRGYIFIRQGTDPANFRLGLAKANSDNIAWSNNELITNTTYLVVVRYYFQNGDDMVRLWINPNLLGSEPTPDVEINSGTDASDLCGILFSQRNKSGHEQIDGLSVATSWAQIPLPVELIAFNANISGNKVSLTWKTATEINNFGFEVERSETSDVKLEMWEKIGFVQGHGNSNSPKEYSFTDFLSGGTAFNYRLKQIDNDGKYEYSNSIKVLLDAPSKSGALQNYPNPFNPSTTICYNIHSQCHTTIKIYDLLGKEVAIIVNEEKQAGIYKVVWNGKDNAGKKLANGVYIYQIIAGTLIQTKKMTLLN
jgi:hypothetical protein